MCPIGDTGATRACLLEIVVPTFNEGDEVRLSVNRLIDELQRSLIEDFRIRVIIDGPVQETIDAARNIEDQRVFVQVLPMNMGKGYALKRGFLVANAEVVAFIDGDLDISPHSIIDGLRILLTDGNERIGCVYGSKFHPESKVDYPLFRRICSAVFRLAIKKFFGLLVEDTQTGVKVFRSEAIVSHLQNLKQNGFLFDVELLARMSTEGWESVPVPVRVDFNYSSSISFITIFRTLIQTVQLAIRFRRSDEVIDLM